jgi:hypothetical protein
MSEAIIAQMQAGIEFFGGGKSGAFLLFIALCVALHAVVLLVRKLFGSKVALTAVEYMASMVWSTYFLAIGWNFVAGLFLLVAAYKLYRILSLIFTPYQPEPEAV